MNHYRTLGFYQSSKGKKYYTVKIDQDGNLSCDCPAWIFKRNGMRLCRHVVAAKEEFRATIEQVKLHGLSVVESPFVPVDY